MFNDLRLTRYYQVTRCTKWLKEACVDVFDSISCGAAMLVCQEGIDTPFSKTGV